MSIVFRRSKLVFNSFNNLISKTITRPHQPTPQFNQFSSLPANPTKTTTQFTLSSLISSARAQKPNFPQIGAARRQHYYVDRNQVHHFKPRGPQKWYQDRRKLLIVVVVGSGVGISVYFGNLETIPYTKRRHFVLLSTKTEKQLGEREFENLKKSFGRKILPAMHPASVRVKMISREIIEALKRGVRQDTVWSDPSYGSVEGGEVGSVVETVRALSDEVEVERDGWRREEEVLDDKWVHQSREKARQHGSEVAVKHLDGLNWEVLVVDEPVVNAFCLPGGKIVVFTGLLQHFKSDAEIATIIGHEVGHAVARHSAEGVTKNMWMAIIQIVLLQFVAMPDVVNAMSNLLLRLPFSRRMEIEADYIGVLLMASAGYDPRIAPLVYEKLGKVGGDSPLRDYLSTHPSGKKRARLLAQARVMEEALAIYKEVRAGRLIQDFL